jgi:hypothetical protein
MKPSLLSIALLALSLACAAHAAAPAPPATAPAPRIVTDLPPKTSFHIYLLMGQSNMAGRGVVPAETDNPHVLALNPDNHWVIARDPLHQKIGRVEPGVGPGLPFALEMLKADPKITIGLVPCAVGGTALSRWVKDADLYKNALERAKTAAAAGTLKGILWHQGESDSDAQKNAESYENRLTQMLSDFRTDLGQPNLPIVVGQLGEFLPADKHPYVDTVRAALKRLPADLPHVGYADSHDLHDKGDQLHFDTDAQKEFGARFAKAMLDLQK